MCLRLARNSKLVTSCDIVDSNLGIGSFQPRHTNPHLTGDATVSVFSFHLVVVRALLWQCGKSSRLQIIIKSQKALVDTDMRN